MAPVGAAKSSPSATPSVVLRALPPLAPLSAATDPVGASLGGPLNGQAAAGFADALRGAGLDPAWVKIDVLPLGDSSESLAVFAIDTTKPNAPTSSTLSDIGNILRAVSSAQAARDAGVTRIAVSLRAQDKGGTFVLTLTVPMSVLQAVAAGQGTLSQPEYARQVVYQMTRIGP
jgi:hypothetical protein